MTCPKCNATVVGTDNVLKCEECNLFLCNEDKPDNPVRFIQSQGITTFARK